MSDSTEYMLDKGQPSRINNYENFAVLIQGIKNNDDLAAETLCSKIKGGILLVIRRTVGYQDLEDIMQDVLATVLNAIQRDQVHHPDALLAFARTIAHRRVSAYVKHAVSERSHDSGPIDDYRPSTSYSDNPEEKYFQAERAHLISRALMGLKSNQREVLQRFYYQEEPKEQICRDMNLTETQFRLLKYRARINLGNAGRRLRALAHERASD